MFVEWIDDHDEGGTLGDDFDARQADTTPKIFPRGQFASWPSNRLAGALQQEPEPEVGVGAFYDVKGRYTDMWFSAHKNGALIGQWSTKFTWGGGSPFAENSGPPTAQEVLKNQWAKAHAMGADLLCVVSSQYKLCYDGKTFSENVQTNTPVTVTCPPLQIWSSEQNKCIPVAPRAKAPPSVQPSPYTQTFQSVLGAPESDQDEEAILESDGTLAGAPIIDPIMVGASKAALVAWSKTPGVSPPLSTYGTDPQDLVPVWSTRDGVMLHSFSIWWNASGKKPTQALGTGNPAQVVLDQEHANALAAWAGGTAGGQQIPNLPVPQPQGGLPIPPPPGWPQSVPWPMAAPPFWPQGLPWPPLATAAAPPGWPQQWPWPPSPSNPIPGVPWPPPGWPTTVPLPIPLPAGWGSPPAQPGLPTPPVQPTLPPTPTQPPLPNPPAPTTSAPAKKSNTLLWIGGGIAAAVALALAAK